MIHKAPLQELLTVDTICENANVTPKRDQDGRSHANRQKNPLYSISRMGDVIIRYVIYGKFHTVL